MELGPEPGVPSVLALHTVAQCLSLCQVLTEHSLKVLLCFEFRGGMVIWGIDIILLGYYDG